METKEVKSKSSFKRGIFLLIGVITTLIIFAIVVSLTYYHDNLVVKNLKEKEYRYELEMIKTDLETYGYLSSETIKEYLRGIEDNYIEDGIPIGLSYAIIIVESDGRFWIEHDEVIPKDLGKKVRAKGATGIIFEFWYKLLVEKEKIIEKDTDLFIPYKAVRSMGKVLKELITQEAKSVKGNKNYNLVNEVIRRYYGEYSKLYYDKTIKITSYLWVKRMNQDLIDNFVNIKKEKEDGTAITN